MAFPSKGRENLFILSVAATVLTSLARLTSNFLPRTCHRHSQAMARNISVPGLLGLGALITGLLAVFLQPFCPLQNSSVWTLIATLHEWNNTPPLVVDAAHNISHLGVRGPSMEHFHNLFYAHDTSGANRFAPPVPVTPAQNTVIDATTPGAWCPQATRAILPFTSLVTNISENCLSLRVARLSGTKPAASLPVLVWVGRF